MTQTNKQKQQQNNMPSGPLTVEEVKKYIDNETSFGFELQVARMLHLMNIDVEHGGQYDDPATDLPREFDLRASIERPRDQTFTYRYFFAIECKRITQETPIIVQTTPRRQSESFHNVVVTPPFHGELQLDNHIVLFHDCLAMRKENGYSIYKPTYEVGKSVEQLIRKNDDIDTITQKDDKIFNKWSQALSSLKDQVQKAMAQPQKGGTIYLNCCLPFLVVPNECLWTSQYREDGTPISDPIKADNCHYFVGKKFTMPKNLIFECSHLEICTIKGLQERLTQLITVEAMRLMLFDVTHEIRKKFGR